MTYWPKLAPRLAAGVSGAWSRAGEDLDDDHAPATAWAWPRQDTVFSGGCVSSPATAKTASNARALAMFPLRLLLREARNAEYGGSHLAAHAAENAG